MDEDATWCGSTLSWPGFRRHIQMSSLRFSRSCLRFVATLHLFSCTCVCAAAEVLPCDLYDTYCVRAGRTDIHARDADLIMAVHEKSGKCVQFESNSRQKQTS